MPAIKVEVDGNGRVRFLYEGFAGDLCLKEAERIFASLKSLGVELDIEDMKRTMQVQETTKEAIKRGW